MKNNIKSFLYNLRRHYILYLVVVIFIPFLVINVANRKTQVPRDRTFNFFLVTDKLESQVLIERVKYSFKDYNIIRSQTFSDSPINDKLMFNQMLEGYGVVQSDVMIIPSSILTETFMASSLKPFKDSRESDLKLNDKSYGIRVYDHVNKTSYVSDYMNTEYQDQDYYLTIARDSYHYNNYINNDESLINSIIKDLYK